MAGVSNNTPVLTVDGPSGSGKGTIAQLIASNRGWHYLDSGALYRVLGQAAIQQGIALDDEAALADLAQNMELEFLPQDSAPVKVLLNGKDLGDALRTEMAGEAASKVAALPGVRQALLAKQRAFREPPGLVTDGRDMGTTVFPTAVCKIFLTASPEARAQRRHKQLMEKGFDVNLPRLLQDIQERDARDSRRSASPLRAAEDALEIDTTSMTILQVVDRVEAALNDALAGL